MNISRSTGRGVGAIIAGAVVPHMGIGNMFLLFSAWSIVLLFMYLAANCALGKNRNMQPNVQEQIEDGNVTVPCLEGTQKSKL